MMEEYSLLTESVLKTPVVFAFSLFFANILQSFYQMIDLLVVWSDCR